MLIAASVFCSGALAQDPAPENIDARLTRCSGKVRVYAAGREAGVRAVAGMPLEEGDRITTGDDSFAELAWESGDSVLRLNADSIFSVKGAPRSDTVFGLKLGGFLAKIRSLVPGQSLRFETLAAVAAVRGTELGIDVPAAGGPAHVGVFEEGKVEVDGRAGGIVLVGPHQETSVAPDGKPTAPSALEYFSRQRREMRALIRRARELQKNWVALDPKERQKVRETDIKAGAKSSSQSSPHAKSSNAPERKSGGKH
jgi:hypothetical protein